jgi:prephenate dehydrogenase
VPQFVGSAWPHRFSQGPLAGPQQPLVTARKQGRHRYYQLRPAALEELRDWLDELEQFWRARLAALGDYLREAPG